MTYQHPERNYVRMSVHETLNGYSIFAVNLNTNNTVPLTFGIATILNVAVPQDYRAHHYYSKDAENELQRLAMLNGWEALEE